jgi:hypothetical protein
MILAPVALNPSLDDAAIRLLAKQFSEGDRDGDWQPDARPVNVVVLVPSDNAAKAWPPTPTGPSTSRISKPASPNSRPAM